MNTHKVDLFNLAVKYFAVCSWAREQPADLAYYKLLDKVTSHETAVAEYHHRKVHIQDSTAFPATVSVSIHAV